MTVGVFRFSFLAIHNLGRKNVGENVSPVREGKERADVMYEEQHMRSDAWKKGV